MNAEQVRELLSHEEGEMSEREIDEICEIAERSEIDERRAIERREKKCNE